MAQHPSFLDDDIARALNDAQRPDEPADTAAMERVRSRLMKRIASDSTAHHVTVRAGEGQWRAFLPGIERKVLHRGTDTMSYLLRFAPGAVLPAHRHPVDEECVVLEGKLIIGDMVLPAGSFHHVPQDVLDADSTTDGGCVIYLRGAIPDAEHML
jgi:anti-sigma factor ChrR (cupin superfamily)